MATPVIQSSASTASAGPTSTCTITKPTGLATGNLMLALLFTYEGTGALSVTDESGWTTIEGATSGFQGFKSMYKVADAGDVAASNFTFDASGSADKFSGIIYRITGFNTASPVTNYDLVAYATNSTNPTFACSVAPLLSDDLLIMGFIGDTSNTSTTVSGYNISGTNPTWTEDFEDTEGADHIASTAHATGNSLSSITQFDVTTTNSCADNIGILIALAEQKSNTQTPSVISIVSSVQTPTLSISFTPSVVTSVVSVQAPTITLTGAKWTTPDKHSSTWDNQNKTV